MVPIEQLLESAEAYRQANQRPLVTLSYAQSVDGSLARQRGQPLRLSGPAAMAMTHRLRAAHDAILVGIGTVLADNPRLTVRLAPGEHPQPVILDSRLRTPPQANLLQHPTHQPWIATTGQAPEAQTAALLAAGARLLPFPADQKGRVPLPALLAALAQEGIASLMVEGGARVIGAFLGQGLANQIVLTIAPVIVGGLPALAAGSLAQSPLPLQEPGWEQMGEDLVLWGRLT